MRWNGFEILHPSIHREQIYKRSCEEHELTETYDYFDLRSIRDFDSFETIETWTISVIVYYY